MPTSQSSARLIRLKKNSDEVAHREQQCSHEAAIHSAAQIAQIAATPDALAGLRTRMAEDEGDRELSECKAKSERDNHALFARERGEYEGAKGE
jgi:hypothetical protein